MGRLKYFLGIEFACGTGKMVLSQRKYALDLLQEAGILKCKLEATPVGPNLEFWDNTSELVEDIGTYQRMIGKLIYLTVTRSYISYAVDLLSRSMHKPLEQ